MENEKTDRAKDQASAQMDSITRMVACLTLDWERLEELRDLAANVATEDEMGSDDLAELAELNSIAEDCEDEDDARQRIDGDPLDVQVRSDWTTPGEEMTPDEYMILLCTGGPAVRITGDLYYGEPCSACLSYQDWGTQWTEYAGDNLNLDTLLAYASNFIAG